MTDDAILPKQESDSTHLLCWRSIIGGLLVSLMVFLTLAALGAGFAGFIGEQMMDRENAGPVLATGTGLYLTLSVAMALFLGSYFALRISRFLTRKVGGAHGIIIASTFFLLMLAGLGNAIGGIASGFSNLAKMSASDTAILGVNNLVQDSIHQILGSSSLKGDPRDVAQGLATRLIQGDTESAKNYLAYQTGQSKANVEGKIAELKHEIDAKAKMAAEKAARAAGGLGVALFVLYMIGLVSAAFGGSTGAHANVTGPLQMRR